MCECEKKNKKQQLDACVPIACSPGALHVQLCPPLPEKVEVEKIVEKKDPHLVLSEKEVERFAYLGLGRGINGTEKTPWLNKSSFEVCHAKFDNLIGTEEGGAAKSYVNQIWDVHTLQVELEAALKPEKEYVSIMVDAEFDRSLTSNRKAVGRKVLNRTIAFKDELGGGDEDFEKQLCKQMLQRIEYRDRGKVPDPSDNPIHDLATILRDSSNLGQLKTQLEEECREFVKQFQVTHYVSAIELGAAEYEVLTEEVYHMKIGAGFGVKASAGGNSVASERSLGWTKKVKRHQHKCHQIGIISKDDKVERGTLDEAVVGVKVRSITKLVKIPELKEALQIAVKKFMVEQSDKSAGPFLISCNDDSIFLKVNENLEVEGTGDASAASEFFIMPNDNIDSEVTFSIICQHPSSKPALRPVPYYLAAPVGLFGSNRGPLRVEKSAAMADTTFILQDRRKQGKHVEISEWTEKEKVFYIKSPARRVFPDSYLCVKEVRGLETAYTTACLSSISCNTTNKYLLFRLISEKKCKELGSSFAAESKF